MGMMDGFWTNKRILVTGYEGFLGSWLTKFLIHEGAQVTGIDVRTRRRETVLTAEELASVDIVKGTVEDYGLLERVCKRRRIGFVFHLAARSLVGECYEDPLDAFSVNIRGTWNVLEACRMNRAVKGVIIASSDKAYGSHERLPYREDFALRGDHPYDASKSCADILSNTYFNTYQVPVCITRCGNLYGPGDFNFSRIVPDAIRCALTGRRLFIRSDGRFIRDYVYVKDIALAYMLLARKMLTTGVSGQAFNFSDEKPLSVIAIVNAVYRCTGRKPDYALLNKAQYEIKRQYLCSRKARRVLGWRPRYSLETGLRETVRWYASMLQGGRHDKRR